MKLYKISIGAVEVYAAGESAEDIYSRRTDFDHTFDYLPVEINEVTLQGYEISVKPVTNDGIPSGRDELKAWLNERNIPYTAQWGEAKLREVALANA
jgi:hypothetical protein